MSLGCLVLSCVKAAMVVSKSLLLVKPRYLLHFHCNNKSMVAAKFLSLPLLSLSPKFIFPRKHSAPYFLILSSFTTQTQTQSQTPDPTFSYGYGPSLHKGTKSTPIHNHPEPLIKTSGLSADQKYQPHKEKEGEDDYVFDEEIFTRVFDIAALRAPAEDCFALESRLRGHLLNWPRIRNIARAPGDEVEAELVELVRDDEIGTSDSLSRRISGKAESDGEPLSLILYREKLARTFNSNGYVNFKNLAKMSRPSKKKMKRKEGEKDEGEKRGGKNGYSLIEVVEEKEEEDMKGLLGNEFKGGKWRGSTRLLLLDERNGDKGVQDFPEAIKALLKDGTKESMESNFELVRCRLTLFYGYWQMDQILEALLPEGMLVPSAFETVGHIAHLNLRDEHLPYKKLIAKVVLDKHQPKIQTVVNKIDAIHNDYRTMQLEVLAGNHSLVTTLVENGLRFHVDLATVYWNSRLATERQRLLSGFTKRDVVCDVFSGVGPIAISAAKIVKRVYANDLNPYAVEYMERNSVLNKLERRIKVFNMDGRRFIHAMYASEKAPSITQVVMNLPNDAPEYLDAFRGILKDRTGDEQFPLPMIHVYGFSKASDPEFDFHERIRIVLGEAAVDVEMRRVRLVAPRKWMLCASFVLPKSVALAKPIHEF